MVRFKNGTEDWIAFVGIYNGHPYEIFTGKIEEDSLYIPKSINKGFIIKVKEEDGQKRYDFRYQTSTATRTSSAAYRVCSTRSSGTMRNSSPVRCATECPSWMSSISWTASASTAKR